MFIILDSGKVVRYVSMTTTELVVENEVKFIKLSYGLLIPYDLFEVVEVQEAPIGQIVNKYCYVNCEFVINPDYAEPVVTKEDIDKIDVRDTVSLLEEQNKALQTNLDAICGVLDTLLIG